MFYTIEILYLRAYSSPYQIITCATKALFNILIILDDSKYVSQFKVSSGDTNFTAKDFGWGEFSKWVNKFNYKKEK
jgi:hypothetical protein